VVEDAATAERLAVEYPDYHFLTPAGEHYHHRLVEGGKGSSAGPLALRRDFRDLERRLAEFESRLGELERRVTLGGPGELIGYLALLERTQRAASARVREQAALIVFPTAAFIAVYEGRSGMSVRLQHAIHGTLLRSLARTNGQLTRLISAARLRGADSEGRALEAARGSQMVNLVEQPH